MEHGQRRATSLTSSSGPGIPAVTTTLSTSCRRLTAVLHVMLPLLLTSLPPRRVNGQEVSEAAPPVSMTSQGNVYVINPGQTIDMQCDFETRKYDMFENPIVWKKHQRGEEKQINIMGNVFDPFLSTKRFEISFSVDEPRYVLSLRIANAMIEDSGNYTCEVRGKKSTVLASVTYYIFVRATVQLLYITNHAENGDLPTMSPTEAALAELEGIASGSTTMLTPMRMTFIDGRPVNIRCIAVGGYPAPSLTIFLGDREVTELVGGVSGQPATSTITIVGSGPSSRGGITRGRPGLRTITTRVELGRVREGVQSAGVLRPSGGSHHGPGSGGGSRGRVEFFAVGRIDDGERLRCVAAVPGLPPNITETIVDVHYGPVIECESRSAYMDELNVYVSCQVRARPGLTSLFWVVDVNGTMVSGGEVTNEYWSVVVDRSDVGSIETQLFMRRATRSSFRSYHLVAENAVSTRTQQVSLVRKFSMSTVTPPATTSLPTVTVRYRPAPVHRVTPVAMPGTVKADLGKSGNSRVRTPSVAMTRSSTSTEPSVGDFRLIICSLIVIITAQWINTRRQ